MRYIFFFLFSLPIFRTSAQVEVIGSPNLFFQIILSDSIHEPDSLVQWLSNRWNTSYTLDSTYRFSEISFIDTKKTITNKPNFKLTGDVLLDIKPDRYHLRFIPDSYYPYAKDRYGKVVINSRKIKSIDYYYDSDDDDNKSVLKYRASIENALSTLFDAVSTTVRDKAYYTRPELETKPKETTSW